MQPDVMPGQSDERHRLLIERAGVAMLIHLEGRIVLANRAALSIVGAERPDEVLGRSLIDFVHRDCHEAIHPILQLTYGDQAAPVVEQTLLRMDGHELPVEIMGVPFLYHDQAAVQVIIRNISERKERESIMRMQASVLETMIEGVVVIDEAQLIVLTNPAFDRIFGYAAGELLGRHISILNAMPRTKSDQLLKQILADLERKPTWSGEFSNRRKDGRRLTTHGHLTPLTIAGQSYLVCVQQDLTEKKVLEAQFLRNQRMEAIGALASGIAHDLNNALAPVLMATDVLQMTSSDFSTTRMLNLIRECTQRSADLVKQVLTFSRGATGARGVVQVSHLLREIVTIARQTFPKTVEIRTEISPNIGTLLADPTQLHQVLLNLCVNARDAMPNGGVLTLSASNVRVDEMLAPMSPDTKPGSYILLSAKDTGTGMSPGVRERIFDPFFSTKAPDKGTGLGLWTVHSIVKSHRGFIQVSSEIGVGTEFNVYLPAQIGPNAPVEESKPPVALTGEGELILVVDDEAAIRNISTQTLQMFGYKVQTASDGSEAVARCAQNLGTIRLVVMDMNMPIMDGAAAIRAIRSIAPDVKFIVTSGLDSRSKVTAAKLQVQSCLFKPYSAEQLLQAIHDVLRAPVNP